MSTARQEYIRLLTRNVEAVTPPEPGIDRNAMFNGELIEAGYCTGVVTRDPNGVIKKCATTGMTVQGRLFLDQLRKEEKEASGWSRSKRWGIPTIAYLIGMITPVISDWLKVVLHLKP